MESSTISANAFLATCGDQTVYKHILYWFSLHAKLSRLAAGVVCGDILVAVALRVGGSYRCIQCLALSRPVAPRL